MLFEIIYVIIGAILAIILLTEAKNEISEITKNYGFDKSQTFVILSLVTAGLIAIWPLAIIVQVIVNARGKS